MFKVGQKVVSLQTFQELVKGEIYTITGIKYCHGCGMQLLSVGLSFPANIYSNQKCSSCYTIIMKESESYYSSKRFAPIEEKSETSVEEFLQTITISQ